MSDADRPAPPAASDERSTEEGVRRWGLDLEEIARRADADIREGRLLAHADVMERARRRIAERRRPDEVPGHSAAPPAPARRRA